MKILSLPYKAIAAASILILSAVQFFLIYNTFKLKNEHYFLSDKKTITDEYGSHISNDRLYPGGSVIIDKYINRNMKELERRYHHNSASFSQFSQRVCDSIALDLIQHNKMDSIFALILQKRKLDKNFEYALTLDAVEIAFKANQYVILYRPGQAYPAITSSIQTPKGLRIGGTLKNMNVQNQAITLFVSNASDYDCKIVFSLYADTPQRNLGILRSMIPIFILSLLSIVSVVLLFFITFKNWLKQKKLADMKSDFVNSLTHEFHTPLAAIIVANKSLQNEKIIENRNNIGPLTDIIQRQSDRLRNLFEQVWNITNTQNLQLHKEEHSLHLLLDDILLDYRLKITDSNIELSFYKGAGNDLATTDSFWLTTMLVNILDNAIKYNNNEQKEIVVSTSNAGNKLLLTIEDNGMGMSQETKKHVFEKFYRNATVLKHTKGLGLGLYYVKLCIDAHEWDIEIESVPEKGSKFIIIIPV
jgi:two-component system phosphate regulon sensor histidine kinase PhoR